MSRQENYFEKVRGGGNAFTKENAIPALERYNFPPSIAVEIILQTLRHA